MGATHNSADGSMPTDRLAPATAEDGPIGFPFISLFNRYAICNAIQYFFCNATFNFLLYLNAIFETNKKVLVLNAIF